MMKSWHKTVDGKAAASRRTPREAQRRETREEPKTQAHTPCPGHPPHFKNGYEKKG